MSSRGSQPGANGGRRDHRGLCGGVDDSHGQAGVFRQGLSAARAGDALAGRFHDPPVSIARPAVINVYVEHGNELPAANVR